MEGCVSAEGIPDDRLRHLVAEGKDYVLAHGILMRHDGDSSELVTYLPFTVFPSPVPRCCHEQAVKVQTDFNLLMHRVAHDHEFLKKCLESTIKVDEFTRRLWSIYETVFRKGYIKPVSLGMNRSDYMLDAGRTIDYSQTSLPKIQPSQISLKQVEFNTMASGMGANAQKLCGYHRYILSTIDQKDKLQQIPNNTAGDRLAEALVLAWRKYNKPQAVMLFLVGSKEYNIFDQRLHEYNVKKQEPDIKIIRRTLCDLYRAELTEDRFLILDGEEIAVIYQRWGYSPTHFTSDKDWEVRLKMELARTVVCPTVPYHLAGTKKVQQELARPGVLEKFLPDLPQSVARIRETFIGLYTLDFTDAGDEAIKKALKNPELFVLKPQREGGGNNLFGKDIVPVLKDIQHSEERLAYILMDRICAVPHYNYRVHCNKPVKLEMVTTEIGIFGSFVGTKDEVYLNKESGFLVRTKGATSDEGGIMMGLCAVDTPLLI